MLYMIKTVFKFRIIRNVSSVISEGSCDTNDWSNDTENSALYAQAINYI